jgi:acetate kinase
MPDVTRVLPVANELKFLGIQRYGFHGLSCESVMKQLKTATSLRAAKRLIIAHLGNGCSITAVKEGKSIDTSMGLTPSGGMMMGTRCGDVDPGILIYLMREKNYDCNALEALINHQSGLLGVSGLSSDMRILHAAAASNPNAQNAIEMFCYSAAKQIGAMVAALDGLDTLVFTGGIGEHDVIVRHMICSQLGYLKIVINDEKNQLVNADNIHTISESSSTVTVRVVKSQENVQIARHAAILLDMFPA